jgi:hypothetical protein
MSPGDSQRSVRTGHVALLATFAVLSVGACACLALNWPGQLSPDSIAQLQQGRAGIYNGWHPPVMAWLLGLFDRLTPGAGAFVVFDVALAYGALMAFAALPSRPRSIAVAVAALLAASPLMLIYQGDVWKDVLFADTSVSGFAFLAWAGRTWPRPMPRYGFATMAFALLALAGLARQNGLVATPIAAAAFAVMAWLHDRRMARAAAHALAALAGCLALAAAGGWALSQRSDGDPAQAEQVAWVQAWDLAGAVRVDPHFDLSRLQATAPDAATLVRGAAKVWTAQRIDSLILFPEADDDLDGAGPALAEAWRRLLLTRPDLYVRERAAVFGQILATPDLIACRPVFVGVDGAQADLKALGLSRRHRPQDDLARAFGLAFVGTPVLSHLAYAALGCLLILLACRDLARSPERAELVAVIGLLAAAMAFSGSFLLVGLACDYRYLYMLDLAAMTALLHRAASGSD